MSAVAKQESKKKLKFSYTVKQRRWVGDGFHVYNLLNPAPELNPYISPFILMDYAAPQHFESTKAKKGVGEHPHRGFETVTLAYQGEVEHRDSSGGGGKIKAGDVQWMTAGKGIVHEEFHSQDFAKSGGTFEMIQLWVNLPKKDKLTKPKYQSIEGQMIPQVDVGRQSKLRVIAGEFLGHKGPASTFTPIEMYDLDSEKADDFTVHLKEHHNTIILVMRGKLELEGETYSERDILIFDRAGTDIDLSVSDQFKGVILSGEPIDEPMVAHGPFVMNTEEEIITAIKDYQAGRMGNLRRN